jgi:hypothetical protein
VPGPIPSALHLLKSWLNILLIAAPLAFVAEHLHWSCVRRCRSRAGRCRLACRRDLTLTASAFSQRGSTHLVFANTTGPSGVSSSPSYVRLASSALDVPQNLTRPALLSLRPPAQISIIPLAKLLGDATEQLAIPLGQTVGGLLNATFGNAVELVRLFLCSFRPEGIAGVSWIGRSASHRARGKSEAR